MNSDVAGSLTKPPPPTTIGSPLACGPFHTHSFTPAVGTLDTCHLSGNPLSQKNVRTCPTVKLKYQINNKGSSPATGASLERSCRYCKFGAGVNTSDSAPDGTCSGCIAGTTSQITPDTFPTPQLEIYRSVCRRIYLTIYLSICGVIRVPIQWRLLRDLLT